MEPVDTYRIAETRGEPCLGVPPVHIKLKRIRKEFNRAEATKNLQCARQAAAAAVSGAE